MRVHVLPKLRAPVNATASDLAEWNLEAAGYHVLGKRPRAKAKEFRGLFAGHVFGIVHSVTPEGRY